MYCHSMRSGLFSDVTVVTPFSQVLYKSPPGPSAGSREPVSQREPPGWTPLADMDKNGGEARHCCKERMQDRWDTLRQKAAD